MYTILFETTKLFDLRLYKLSRSSPKADEDTLNNASHFIERCNGVISWKHGCSKDVTYWVTMLALFLFLPCIQCSMSRLINILLHNVLI